MSYERMDSADVVPGLGNAEEKLEHNDPQQSQSQSQRGDDDDANNLQNATSDGTLLLSHPDNNSIQMTDLSPVPVPVPVEAGTNSSRASSRATSAGSSHSRTIGQSASVAVPRPPSAPRTTDTAPLGLDGSTGARRILAPQQSQGNSALNADVDSTSVAASSDARDSVALLPGAQTTYHDGGIAPVPLQSSSRTSSHHSFHSTRSARSTHGTIEPLPDNLSSWRSRGVDDGKINENNVDDGNDDMETASVASSTLSFDHIQLLPTEMREEHEILLRDLEVQGETIQHTSDVLPYDEEFAHEVKDDVLVIGSIPVDEVEKQQRLIEESRARELDEELERQRVHLDMVAQREKLARRALHEEANQLRSEFHSRENQLTKRHSLQLREQQQAFRKAQDTLRHALQEQQGELHEYFGTLEDADDKYGVVKGRHYRVDWAMAPRVIRIRIDMLRAIKNKLPRGRYVVMATLYDRLGGHPLRWCQLNGIEWTGSTPFPVRHNGKFYDIEMSFAQKHNRMFLTLPSAAETRPSMVLVFELFLCRGKRTKIDRVVGWGAFPISTGSKGFEAVEGPYKVPLLRGEMDPTVDKFERFEQIISSNLDSWLCNMYFDVRHLPRYLNNQMEYEVELQFSNQLLQLATRDDDQGAESNPDDSDEEVYATGGDTPGVIGISAVAAKRPQNQLIEERTALLDGVDSDSNQGISRDGDSDDVDHKHNRSDSGNAMRITIGGVPAVTGTPGSPARRGSPRTSLSSIPDAANTDRTNNSALANISMSMMGGGRGSPSNQQSRPRTHRLAITLPDRSDEQRIVLDSTQPSNAEEDASYAFAKAINSHIAVSPRAAARAMSVQKSMAQLNSSRNVMKKSRANLNNARNSRRDISVRVKAKKHKGVFRERPEWNPNVDFTAKTGNQVKKQHQLAKYSFSVVNVDQEVPSTSETSEKLRYIGSELLADLGLHRWKTLEFWATIAIMISVFWFRLYLHCSGQYLFLKSMRVPVFEFDVNLYRCSLQYSSDSLTTTTEVGFVMMGVCTNILVFVFFKLFAMLSQSMLRGFPDTASRFMLSYGIFTLLDPYIVLATDLFRSNWSGDSFKLYSHFESTEGNGMSGIFLTVVITASMTVFMVFLLYTYLLHIHMNGRMLDVYYRLHGDESVFFVPDDMEISVRTLRWVIEQAKAWRGFHGATRKISVTSYVMKDHMDPTFVESTVHLALYTQSISGERELFRHFVRRSDGAIIELFDSVETLGAEKFRSLEKLLLSQEEATNRQVDEFVGDRESSSPARRRRVAARLVNLPVARERQNAHNRSNSLDLPNISE
jgi:hypothetical protein